MSNPFTPPPPPSGGIKWDEHKGHLLIIEPYGIETDIETEFGKTDAVQGTITFVDGPKAGEIMAGVLVFPKVLKSQLKSQLGKKVLGRLGQGNAKGSQSPPWVILEATEADIAKATDLVNRQTTGSFTKPAATSSPASAGRQGWADDPPPF